MKSVHRAALATAALGIIAFGYMGLPAFATDRVVAETPDSGTMERADDDMKKVLAALQALGPKPIETLTPAEARQQPTPADAVNAVLREDGKQPEEVKAAMGVVTMDTTYPAGSGTQPVRLYRPDEVTDQRLPVIVYYHGGGWVIADIDVYDAAPRALAKKANAIVVSAEYRHAPENKFPAAHDDAFAAYRWVLQNAAEWGGDPSRIAVAGESAGGNLAANVAIMARDENVQMPMHMLLVYPVAATGMDTPSYRENANARPLGKAAMKWFAEQTVKSDADLQNPMLNLIAANLRGLPSATVINAEIDPLRSEGETLANLLDEAGSDVNQKTYEGVTHEFFGMAAVVDDAEDAQDVAADDLKDAFAKRAAPRPDKMGSR